MCHYHNDDTTYTFSLDSEIGVYPLTWTSSFLSTFVFPLIWSGVFYHDLCCAICDFCRDSDADDQDFAFFSPEIFSGWDLRI